MADINAVRPFARSSVRAFVPQAPVLERCARAVAKASGYAFTGNSILESANHNPRAARFVTIARAVLQEAQSMEAK